MLYSRGRHHRPLRTPNPNIGVGANLSERVGVNLAECPGAYSPEWWAPSHRNLQLVGRQGLHRLVERQPGPDWSI